MSTTWYWPMNPEVNSSTETLHTTHFFCGTCGLEIQQFVDDQHACPGPREDDA